MPAVVRVKRRIDEEPLTSFILNGKKRRRVNEDGDGAPVASTDYEDTDFSESGAVGGRSDEISTVLKFAGTIHKQDDTATTQLARLTKDAAKELVQQKTQSRKATNHTERARQEMRQSLHENRFRVVNCMRTTLNGFDVGIGVDESSASNTKEVTIVDIEKHNVNSEIAAASPVMPDVVDTTAAADQLDQQSEYQQSQSHDSDTGYVYDLYLPENEQHVDLMDDNYISVRAFDDLVYENEAEDDDYDSEDSNDENCPGNDYPDEEDSVTDANEEYNVMANDDDEDNESVGAREMRHGIEKFVFDDSDDSEKNSEHDGSSDDYDIDDDDIDDDDIDDDDVDRHGKAYAKHRAHELKRLEACNSDNDDDYFDDANDEEKSDPDEHYQSASENENITD